MKEPILPNTTRPPFHPGSIVELHFGGKPALYRCGKTPESAVTPLSGSEILGFYLGAIPRRLQRLWWKVCPGAEKRYFDKIAKQHGVQPEEKP